MLELGNIGVLPVALYPGMKICSFTFEELSSPSENPYAKRKNAKYTTQKTPLASRISDEMGASEARYARHGKKSVRIS